MAEHRGIFSFFKNLISDSKKPTEVVTPEHKGHSPASPAGTVARSMTATPLATGVPVPDDIAEFGLQKLQEILDLSFGGTTVITDQGNDELCLEVLNATDSSRLIGKDGMTLDALQTIVRAIIFKRFGANVRVSINTEDYKRRREDQIRTQAEKALNTVLTKNSRVSLRPMNAAERRLVHLIFEGDNRVRTFSSGNGTYRHIVVEKRGPKSTNVPR
jgi:spoIIIJ-associated protein